MFVATSLLLSFVKALNDMKHIDQLLHILCICVFMMQDILNNTMPWFLIYVCLQTIQGSSIFIIFISLSYSQVMGHGIVPILHYLFHTFNTFLDYLECLLIIFYAYLLDLYLRWFPFPFRQYFMLIMNNIGKITYFALIFETWMSLVINNFYAYLLDLYLRWFPFPFRQYFMLIMINIGKITYFALIFETWMSLVIFVKPAPLHLLLLHDRVNT